MHSRGPKLGAGFRYPNFGLASGWGGLPLSSGLMWWNGNTVTRRRASMRYMANLELALGWPSGDKCQVLQGQA